MMGSVADKYYYTSCYQLVGHAFVTVCIMLCYRLPHFTIYDMLLFMDYLGIFKTSKEIFSMRSLCYTYWL